MFVSLNADAGELGIIFDSSLSHEGDLIILALELLDPQWKQFLTLTLLTSNVWLWQSCCVREDKWPELCLCDYTDQSGNISLLTQVSWNFLCWHSHFCVSIRYLKPERWRSCSELQPERATEKRAIRQRSRETGEKRSEGTEERE